MWCYWSPCAQAVAAVVLVHERQTRTRSSAILFLFWLGMIIYSSIRARTLALREKEVSQKSKRIAIY